MTLQNAFENLAVESKQDAEIDVLEALLAELQTKLDGGGNVSVSNLPATQPVSAAALPLPAGAATSAKQDSLITAIAAIATQVTAQLIYDKLVDIYAAVDGLEVTAGNIEINSDTINLQTDEVEALLQAVRDRLPAALDVDGGLKAHVQNLPASYSLPDSQVAALMQRDLDETTDAVRSVDAAEDAALTAVPFTITSTGTTTLVAAPGGAALLRLRRLSPTYAIRSPDSEPVLALFVGSVEAQRGNALTGRFDVTAGADSDAITLDVDVLDPGGVVAGTVYYELT